MGNWTCTADLRSAYFSAGMFGPLGLPVGDAPPSSAVIANPFAVRDWARTRQLLEPARRDKTAWDGEFPRDLAGRGSRTGGAGRVDPNGWIRTIRSVGNPVPQRRIPRKSLCTFRQLAKARQCLGPSMHLRSMPYGWASACIPALKNCKCPQAPYQTDLGGLWIACLERPGYREFTARRMNRMVNARG
jgi:hypothetical protein